jgi:hypothetical protein
LITWPRILLLLVKFPYTWKRTRILLSSRKGGRCELNHVGWTISCSGLLFVLYDFLWTSSNNWFFKRVSCLTKSLNSFSFPFGSTSTCFKYLTLCCSVHAFRMQPPYALLLFIPHNIPCSEVYHIWYRNYSFIFHVDTEHLLLFSYTWLSLKFIYFCG